MRIAITGGSGFVGRHLAPRLAADGHQVIAVARGVRPWAGGLNPDVSFVSTDLTSADRLAEVFEGCDAVVHCAGINREIGSQTFQRVHIEGTRHVVEAAKRVGVRRLTLMSFLRARPECGSPYHESKWAAEEILRESGLEYCIVRAG